MLFYALPIFAVLIGANIFQPNAKAANPADDTFASNPAVDIAACSGQSECFAFTVDTRLTSTGATTGTATSFSLPTSGYVGGSAAHSYSWIVDWGDGTNEVKTGTSASASVGIAHNYATAGEYQIAVRPNGATTNGWFNAFGFYGSSTGANVAANKYMLRSINAPLTNLMRTAGSTYRFAYLFYGTSNGIGIPTGLLANITTDTATTTANVFFNTFNGYAYNSTAATIPAGLFSSIDTSSSTNTVGMFSNTFYNYARNAAAETIPAGLFDSIDTSNATTTSNMFNNTFYNYAYNSTAATIPAGLFNSIDTSSAVTTTSMFMSTFGNYAGGSTAAAGTIPAGLFNSIDTSSATNTANMFYSTFASYARLSTTGTIPGGLFNSIDTGSATNTNSMFYGTFSNYAYNSTAGTIPAGLFNSIDTSSATNTGSMFNETFSSFAFYSTTGTIPSGLFDSIDTSNVVSAGSMFSGTFKNFAFVSTAGSIPAGLFNSIDTSSATGTSAMFNATFNNYARNSSTATIPTGLFSSIDTSSATNTSNMFNYTFYGYAYNSTAGTIPSDLFAGISTSASTNTSGMFFDTFTSYATRRAQFSVNGAIVNTQSFTNTYATKIGPTGIPSANPTVAAGDTIYPTHNATVRNITAPTGIYTGYSWYTKDSTSCSAPSPTANCGPQDASTLVSFPNTTQWTPATSTEKSNVIFYALAIDPPVIASPTNGFLTNNTQPAISGTGEIGATVSVLDGAGNILCTATVTGGGTWTCNPAAALASGYYAIKATQEDGDGHISNPSNIVNITIDTINPSSNVSVNTSIGGANNPIISFTTYDNIAVSHTDILYIDVDGNSATAANATSPITLNLDPSESVHTITVRTYDTAGNYYNNVIAFPPTVNFTTPTIISNVAIDDATVTVTTPSGDDVASVVLDPGVSSAVLNNCVGAGGDIIAPYAQPVTCEIHNVDVSTTIKVTAVDAVNGAVGYNNTYFKIDTVPPVITAVTPTMESNTAITDTVITVTDDVAINADDVVISAVVTGGNFTIDSYDCAQIYTSKVECTVQIAGSTGTGNVDISATDVAGNTSAKTITGYVIDSTAPEKPVINATNGRLLSGTAEPGSTITITYTDQNNNEHVVTTTTDPNGSWSIILNPNAKPGSTISATATDRFGNVSAVATITVNDTVVPGTPNTGLGNAKGQTAPFLILRGLNQANK